MIKIQCKPLLCIILCSHIRGIRVFALSFYFEILSALKWEAFIFFLGVGLSLFVPPLSSSALFKYVCRPAASASSNSVHIFIMESKKTLFVAASHSRTCTYYLSPFCPAPLRALRSVLLPQSSQFHANSPTTLLLQEILVLLSVCGLY